MEIKNQVCILEQAKRLKELGLTRVGCKSEVGFYYWTGGNPKDELYYEDAWPSTDAATAAFTVAELGVMLPALVHSFKSDPFVEFAISQYFVEGQDNPFWGYDEEAETEDARQVFKTEAEARAAMLIYLLENNLVTADEVNKRLQAA